MFSRKTTFIKLVYIMRYENIDLIYSSTLSQTNKISKINKFKTKIL